MVIAADVSAAMTVEAIAVEIVAVAETLAGVEAIVAAALAAAGHVETAVVGRETKTEKVSPIRWQKNTKSSAR